MPKSRTYEVKRFERDYDALAVESELGHIIYFVAKTNHPEDGIVIVRDLGSDEPQKIVIRTEEIKTLLSDIKGIAEAFLW